MISLLLFVIGCYALVAATVHLYYRLCQHQQAEKHFVLLFEQQKEQMESILRSMYSFSRWMGVSVRVSIVSTVQCHELDYMTSYCNDRWFPVQVVKQNVTPDYAVVVDLDKEQDLRKLPF